MVAALNLVVDSSVSLVLEVMLFLIGEAGVEEEGGSREGKVGGNRRGG